MNLVRNAFMIGVLALLFLSPGQSFIPAIPVAVGGITAALGYYTSICLFKECCTDKYIPANFTMLNQLLNNKFYGQHMAQETVMYALQGHVNTIESKKALVLSFHGLPGLGKNYMINFIVNSLYEKGIQSKYVHLYKGRLHFPSDGMVSQYQKKLQEDVFTHLQSCPRSIFIFDEVDKIPEGTLNALVPFMDYHSTLRDVNPTQAIFIFLSNTGGNLIAKELLQMWERGKKREETRLQDFESLLSKGAFNEKGGFHKSDAIETSLIDHYIPFLPLEEVHVRKCIYDAFERRDVIPDDSMIEFAMSFVTFGPSPHNLYSNAGCKNLDAKVSYIIERHVRDRKNK